MRIRPGLALAAATVIAATAIPAGASPAAGHTTRRTPVTVMTRNLYLGIDLIPLVTAAPGAPFEHAVANGLAAVEATGPSARMKLVAGEIARAKPDLVGLQEVTVWSTGPIGGRPKRVVADYLKVIMAELRRLHAPYRVAALHYNLHLEARTTSQEVFFTIGDAVLARSGVAVHNVRSGDFKHLLKIPVRGLGTTVTVTRSWNALDATVRGARFHFVNTHLEAYTTAERLEQARELVAGPLKSKLETILVGDLNSNANLPKAGDRPPYLAIRNAGFKEERTSQNSCCFNGDLRTGRWDHNVDHIMAKPGVTLLRSFLTGRETTSTGRHPSDHGGVVSVLAL